MGNRNKKACVVIKYLGTAGRFVLTLDADRVNPDDVEILAFAGLEFDNYYFAQKVAATVNAWINQIYPDGYIGTIPCAVRTCTVSNELNLIFRDSVDSWACFDFTGGHSSCTYSWIKEGTLPVRDKGISSEFINRVQKHYDSVPGGKYRLKASSLNAIVRIK